MPTFKFFKPSGQEGNVLGKPFRCSKCNRMYKLKSSLTRHSKLCSKEIIQPSEAHSDTSAERSSILDEINPSDISREVPSKYSEPNGVNRNIYLEKNLFECSLCNKWFKFKSSLGRHLRQKCSNETINSSPETTNSEACDERSEVPVNCSKSSEQSGKVCCEEKLFECSLCKKWFKYKRSLSKHVKKQVCLGEIADRESDACSEALASKSEDRPDIINRKLVSAKSVLSHSKAKSFVCLVCDKVFFTLKVLKQHMNTHSGKTPFKCQECNKSFKLEVYLWQHLRTHKGGTRCFKCDEWFTSFENFKKHFMRSHPRYKCTLCDRSFHFKKSFDKHMLDNHNHAKGDGQNCRLANCKGVEDDEDDCSWRYITPPMQNRSSTNYVKVNSNYVCTICNKVFTLQTSASRHAKIHQGFKFKCDICKQLFSRKHRLATHMQKIHRQRLEWTNYKIESKLKVGNKTTQVDIGSDHQKETLHKCATCGLVFIHLYELNAHSRIHTGEKPYECSLCGETFYGRNHLQHHMNTCH